MRDDPRPASRGDPRLRSLGTIICSWMPSSLLRNRRKPSASERRYKSNRASSGERMIPASELFVPLPHKGDSAIVGSPARLSHSIAAAEPQTQAEEKGSRRRRPNSVHAAGRSPIHATSAQRKTRSATNARGKGITARSVSRKMSTSQAKPRSSTPQPYPRERRPGTQTLWSARKTSSPR